MLKSCFQNTEPKLLNYRDFRTIESFSLEAFKENLSKALIDCGDSYDKFDNIFTSTQNKHVS